MTAADDLTDGSTIDAFWVNPTLDGATPGQVLAALKPPRTPTPPPTTIRDVVSGLFGRRVES